MPSTYTLRGAARRQVARSKEFNIDNGAGVTLDDCILRHSRRLTLHAARVVYSDATTGTVAAATVKVGTTVNGTEIVAATNLENTKAVGTTTTLTLVSTDVAANTPIIVRHTGVAITQAGTYYVEVEYSIAD